MQQEFQKVPIDLSDEDRALGSSLALSGKISESLVFSLAASAGLPWVRDVYLPRVQQERERQPRPKTKRSKEARRAG